MATVEQVTGYDCDWPECVEGALGHRRVTIGKERGLLPSARLIDLCPQHLEIVDQLRRHIQHVGRVPA